MISSDLVGLVAVAVSSSIAIPQVYRIYIDKAARDVSVLTMIMSLAAQALWFGYATMVGDKIIAFASFPATAVILIELVLYYRYR